MDAVVSLVRRPIESKGKLEAIHIDFDNPPRDAPWWQADAVICTLGTTMRAAGSRESFRKVDHDYPLMIARLAKQHGVPNFVLNSAMGANASSRIFYNRVKGEVEQDLRKLNFPCLVVVRPGLIGGERTEQRPGEKLAAAFLGIMGPLLPRKWRINPAQRIAEALLESALSAPPGVTVIPSESLT